jgi:hypothetical protein
LQFFAPYVAVSARFVFVVGNLPNLEGYVLTSVWFAQKAGGCASPHELSSAGRKGGTGHLRQGSKTFASVVWEHGIMTSEAPGTKK